MFAKLERTHRTTSQNKNLTQSSHMQWEQQQTMNKQQHNHLFKNVVSYKRKYVHELLVNRLFKPAQEKVRLSELTVPQ